MSQLKNKSDRLPQEGKSARKSLKDYLLINTALNKNLKKEMLKLIKYVRRFTD